VGPRAGKDVLVRRKFSLPCRNSNPGSSFYQVQYPGLIVGGVLFEYKTLTVADLLL
jgi:hypothetical protein